MNARTHVANLLKNSADDLAADNAAALEEQNTRDYETLRQYVKRIGVSNTVGHIATIVSDLEFESDDDSQEKDDLTLARKVLEAAEQATDLTYGNNEHRFLESRRTAVRGLYEFAKAVRT